MSGFVGYLPPSVDTPVQQLALLHMRLQLSALPADFSNRYLSAEECQRLRLAGPAVDERLAGKDPANSSKIDSRFRTLVHGDAKPENLLCSEGSSPRCAALDFGWVGEGYGVYDVAYLLWDQIATNVVEDFLSLYHQMLLDLLPPASRAAYTHAILKQHFDLAVVDFIRWELGFKGGTYFWAMPWAVQILRDVLNQLDGGVPHPPAHYAVAVSASQVPSAFHLSRGDAKLPVTVQDGEAQTDGYELGTPRAAAIRGAAASGACSRHEEEEFIERIRDAVRQLHDARQRQVKAKAGEQRALEEIRKREAVIEQLRDDLA
ncbi:pkn1 [Symbiodinium pilosum]|uniref:Pkn1 protein n=1 Tax=Symbiodinium pilosum TaxID=2952 RepID=A0A812XC95_SYMPI|nr:pkn1 [Symbiodinium pilosum]